MESNKFIPIVIVIVILTLERIEDNLIFSAAYLALTEFGKIHPQNLAYETLLELHLIKPDGTDAFGEGVLLSALQYVTGARISE